MGSIAADFQKFAAAERCYRITLQAFEETLSELDQNLKTHLSQWDGEAAAAYHAFFRTWHASARDMAAELARLRRAIEVAHHNFRSAKAASTRMWTL